MTLRLGVIILAWPASGAHLGAQNTDPHPPAPPAQPAPPAPNGVRAPATGKVWHLRITGDLDSDRLARDFAAELDRAASANAALLLLELDGNRSRPDVVLAMGRRVTECRVRTAAYLADGRDRRVGIGQLMLGVLCTDAFVAPGTRVVHTAADDLRALAPDDTDWRRIADDLIAEAGTRIESRSGDARLAGLLVAPVESAWFVAEADPARIETDPPPGPGAQFVYFASSGPDRIEIDAALAVSLRLARGIPAGVPRLLTDLGARAGSPRTQVKLSSGLGDAERRLEREMGDLRVAMERIQETLRVTAAKLDRRPQPSDYRRAGNAALQQIDAADRALADAESLTAEYPELLRDAVPTPSAGRARLLTDLRRDLDRRRATAEEYRSRR